MQQRSQLQYQFGSASPWGMLMLRYCDARCTPGFSEEVCDDRSPNACAGLSFRSVLQGMAVNYLPVFCNMEIDLSISIDELGNNYSVLVLCQCNVGKGTCTSFGGSDSLELYPVGSDFYLYTCDEIEADRL